MKTIKDKLREYFIREGIGCQDDVEHINIIVKEHVVGLIKETLNQCLQPLTAEPYNIPPIAIHNCIKELKKRIEGWWMEMWICGLFIEKPKLMQEFLDKLEKEIKKCQQYQKY